MGLRQLLVVWSVLALASQGLAQGCEGWNTSVFFLSATLAEVESCLAAGADVNAQSAGLGNTPLHLAARFSNSPAVIEVLLDAGADATARDLSGNTPWDYAKDREELQSSDAYQRLGGVQAPAANLEMESPPLCKGLNTRLFFPTATLTDVVTCISTGADLNARGEYGMTPLHFAAALNDNPTITAALIGAGAKLEARSEEGHYSPLHLAARYNLNPFVIEILLDRGAKVRARDHANLFPWDYAADREALQGTDVYRRLEPGLVGRVGRGAVGLYVAAVAATSKVFAYLWDILLDSFGMAREMLAIFGEGAGWVVTMVANPTIFLEAYSSLTSYARNLTWSNIDPTKYQRAGMRGGVRSLEAAKGIWETIPAGARARGPEATLESLRGMDWSHTDPYIPGLNDGPEHGIFEDSSLNRARGRAPMTADEIEAARRVWQRINVKSIIDESAKIGAKTALASAAVEGMVAVLEYGLEYQEGKITADEMLSKIAREVALAGIGGAAISGLVVAVALTFPPLIPVMSTISVPLMVFGFAVMGARLVEAGIGWYEVYRQELLKQSLWALDWIVEYYEYLKAKVLGLVPYLTS